MSDLVREHRQVIIRASVSRPPNDANRLSEWTKEVIEAVGMKVMHGPHVVYDTSVGNRGFTALAILNFSHVSIHCWDEESPALIEFDLFSCKRFSIKTVLEKLDEFGLVGFNLKYINRDELPRDDKNYIIPDKIYMVYKTQNKINGKFYIGVHGFTDLCDGYLGSGRALKKAVKKYGRDQFTQQYIDFFYNSEEALALEYQLVTEELVRNQNCYNMTIGGKGNLRIDSIKYVWITDNTSNRFVPISSPIPDGWRRGRLNKKGKTGGWNKGKKTPLETRIKASNSWKERLKNQPHHNIGKKYKKPATKHDQAIP